MIYTINFIKQEERIISKFVRVSTFFFSMILSFMATIISCERSRLSHHESFILLCRVVSYDIPFLTNGMIYIENPHSHSRFSMPIPFSWFQNLIVYREFLFAWLFTLGCDLLPSSLITFSLHLQLDLSAHPFPLKEAPY